MRIIFFVFYLLSFLSRTYLSLVQPFYIDQANISALLSAAAYCGKDKYNNLVWKEPANGFILQHIIHDNVSDMQGFVAVLPSEKTIYIVFRGSQTIRNWLEDLEFIQIQYQYCDCKVHYGFYKTALNIMDGLIPVIKKVKEQYHNYSVIVTGHSYGSAVAQLISIELLVLLQIESTVYTFGQPRIGDANYANFINTKINLWRIVHNRDIVPHIPFTNGLDYYHSCGEVFEDEYNYIHICSKTDCEDITCSQQYQIKNTNVKDHMIYLGHNMTCEYYL